MCKHPHPEKAQNLEPAGLVTGILDKRFSPCYCVVRWGAMIGCYDLLSSVELFVLISFVFPGTTLQAVKSYSQHTVIYRKLATLYLLPDHLLFFPYTRKAPCPYFALLYTGWTFKLVSLQRALLPDICVFA